MKLKKRGEKDSNLGKEWVQYASDKGCILQRMRMERFLCLIGSITYQRSRDTSSSRELTV